MPRHIKIPPVQRSDVMEEREAFKRAKARARAHFGLASPQEALDVLAALLTDERRGVMLESGPIDLGGIVVVIAKGDRATALRAVWDTLAKGEG